jgi:microcystin-dependent protein
LIFFFKFGKIKQILNIRTTLYSINRRVSMKKDMLNTVLLVCVLVVLIAIAIILAADSGKEIQVVEAGAHTHDEYVEVSGDTMSGDLVVQNLHSNANINGNGANLLNLNASRINSGTIGSARLPSDIDAATLDGLDSFDFSLALHNHNVDYFTKSESDARFALVGHSHPSSGDADTLDGYDSAEFSFATHVHDSRYYQKSEVDSNFLSLGGGTLTGDLYLPDLYASGIISGNGGSLTNLNASAITSGTIGIARLPPNIDADTLDGLDSLDLAMAIHTHNATHITEGKLDEDRLPQYAIDETEIDPLFGLVPSGTIVMWNGTSIPSGWALCDGTNGTPDLRGLFIAGYDPMDADYDAIGNIGGEKTHTLTTTEMPSHSHTVTGSTSTNGNHFHNYEDRYSVNNIVTIGGGGTQVRDDMENFQSKSTIGAGDHSHSISGTAAAVGGGQAHENRPPYYVLAFIMKL